MKATGIVRRIDDWVIIGQKFRSLENTGFSLILSKLSDWNISGANRKARTFYFKTYLVSYYILNKMNHVSKCETKNWKTSGKKHGKIF